MLIRFTCSLFIYEQLRKQNSDSFATFLFAMICWLSYNTQRSNQTGVQGLFIGIYCNKMFFLAQTVLPLL